MFKIPEKIRIGFVDYRVEIIERFTGDRNIIGEHVEEEGIIQIAERLNPRTQGKTFIHECLHAVVAQYGIGVDEEERLIDQLSTGISEIVEQIVDYSVREYIDV